MWLSNFLLSLIITSTSFAADAAIESVFSGTKDSSLNKNTNSMSIKVFKGTSGREVSSSKKGTTPKRKLNPFTSQSSGEFLWPVDGGQITSLYGWRTSRRFHDGLDIGAPTGTRIFASKSGKVIYSGNRIRGYGNMIVVKHNGGFSTVYAHNKSNRVRKGDFVRRGGVIAYLGSTGRSTGPHLHFEIRKGKYSMDPLKYLKGSKAKAKSKSRAVSRAGAVSAFGR